MGHFLVPGEIANNGYAKDLGGNRGVLWDCASSEFCIFISEMKKVGGAQLHVGRDSLLTTKDVSKFD